MTEEQIEVLKAEYLRLKARQSDQVSADELAGISHHMGEILAKLQDAGVDTYAFTGRGSHG